MRILIAPDKFKGSLDACEVAENIAAGLREALPDAEVALLPIADGGEGTVDAICASARGEWTSCAAHDANGGSITARYAILAGGETAVLETSEAIGLWRLPQAERDPMRASSFGAGEMLLDVAKRGVREIIVGLGGSATNDGGVGMARALGFRFHNADGEELGDAVADLIHLARLVPPPELKLPRITGAADVRNPLLGRRGATRVFGAQKGAGPGQMERLELALERLADVAAVTFGHDFRELPGAGAAGGLGFALMAFCGAEVRAGFDVVAEEIGLEDAVCRADVIITGEGRLDAQTLDGKAPAGLARLARRHGKRCFAIVGALEETPELLELFDGISVLGNAANAKIADTAGLLRQRARDLGEGLAAGR